MQRLGWGREGKFCTEFTEMGAQRALRRRKTTDTPDIA
jgi:hypothetical protein